MKITFNLHVDEVTTGLIGKPFYDEFGEQIGIIESYDKEKQEFTVKIDDDKKLETYHETTFNVSVSFKKT